MLRQQPVNKNQKFVKVYYCDFCNCKIEPAKQCAGCKKHVCIDCARQFNLQIFDSRNFSAELYPDCDQTENLGYCCRYCFSRLLDTAEQISFVKQNYAGEVKSLQRDFTGWSCAKSKKVYYLKEKADEVVLSPEGLIVPEEPPNKEVKLAPNLSVRPDIEPKVPEDEHLGEPC